MKAPAPKYAANDGVIAAAQAALGDMLIEATDLVGEVNLTVDRARLPEAMIALRDGAGLQYQALMEIAGVDYPGAGRAVRCLLHAAVLHPQPPHPRSRDDG